MSLVGCSSISEESPADLPPVDEISAATVSTTSPSSTLNSIPPRVDKRVIGRSVLGRPIEIWHRVDLLGASTSADDPNRVVVLVIGSIHGNEPAGLDIVDALAEMPRAIIDEYGLIDLWLLPTGNPDGIADGTRHNARQVDLNRNFPLDWAPLQRPGDYEYSGTGPASEPETQVMMKLIDGLRPDLTVWFHQDAYRVAPSWRDDRRVRELYAYLTGLPMLAVEGGTYTGVAATWHRRTYGEVSFIVELGRTLSREDVLMHAKAVLAVTSVLSR